MKYVLAVYAILILCGCAGNPQLDEQVLRCYQVGRARDGIQRDIGSVPLESIVRPKEGWSGERFANHGTGLAARRFEVERHVEVHRTEVYWIGRHTSVPLALGGVWWDYLFYDSSDRLLGYYRRFLD